MSKKLLRNATEISHSKKNMKHLRETLTKKHKQQPLIPTKEHQENTLDLNSQGTPKFGGFTQIWRNCTFQNWGIPPNLEK